MSIEDWALVSPGFDLIDTGTDGHVHTRLCGHAEGEIEDYVQAALKRGLAGIVFLEHFETAISYFETTWLSPEDFRFYQQELQRLQKKYEGRIAIGIGVEAGYNPEHPEKIRSFLNTFSWDRVGLSYHYLKLDSGRHVNMVSRKTSNIELLAEKGASRVVDEYLRGLLEAVKQIDADVVCHLDAVMRHHNDAVFAQKNYDTVRDIFKIMIEKGMALEVNTSGFPQRGKPYPAPEMLKMAMNMGIRLTPGSDAHNPCDVGRYFEKLPGLLREIYSSSQFL
ncbi:MAG: histidinol-phosphatase [Thermodesulfobacteriota bacterium]